MSNSTSPMCGGGTYGKAVSHGGGRSGMSRMANPSPCEERHLWRKGHQCAITSSMRATSCRHGVLPARREAASPEAVTAILADQIATREYGFRAAAFGRPRNDPLSLRTAPSSMRAASSMEKTSSMGPSSRPSILRREQSFGLQDRRHRRAAQPSNKGRGGRG
jgi:hypothetical protein